MAQNLNLDLPTGHLAEHCLYGRPFAPRAALNAIADCGEQLLGPVAQGLLDDGVGLVLAKLSAQRAKHRHQDLSLDPSFVQERYVGIHKIVVEDTGHSFAPKRTSKPIIKDVPMVGMVGLLRGMTALLCG